MKRRFCKRERELFTRSDFLQQCAGNKENNRERNNPFDLESRSFRQEIVEKRQLYTPCEMLTLCIE